MYIALYANDYASFYFELTFRDEEELEKFIAWSRENLPDKVNEYLEKNVKDRSTRPTIKIRNKQMFIDLSVYLCQAAIEFNDLKARSEAYTGLESQHNDLQQTYDNLWGVYAALQPKANKYDALESRYNNLKQEYKILQDAYAKLVAKQP